MRQFFSIFIDSLYEAIDHKALLFLVGFSFFLIAFCAGISFKTDAPETVLEQQCMTFGSFPQRFMNMWVGPIDCSIRDVKEVEASEGWDDEMAGGHAVTIGFKNQGELDKLVQRWRALKESLNQNGGRDWKMTIPGQYTTPVSETERVEFFDMRFKRYGYHHVQSKRVEGETPAYRVAVRSDYPFELNGAAHLQILYGSVDVPLPPNVSVAEAIVWIQLRLANTIGGFIGVLVAVMVCSSFVPSMLQKGSLDLVLARPIGRVRLLLYKYLGGLWFVFIYSTVLILGCWLALTLRTGYVNFWFLATIGTITATFAVVYAVAVLAGVITRSGTVSALCAIFVWGASSTLIFVRDGLQLLYFGRKAPEWLKTTLDLAYDIAPKTADLNTMNTYFLAHSWLSKAAFQRAFQQHIPYINWAWSMGTTAAFGIVTLGIAAWYFRRRDY